MNNFHVENSNSSFVASVALVGRVRLTLLRLACGALRLAGLRLGGLPAGALPGTMAGVTAIRTDLLIGATPVAQLLFGEGPIGLECRTELDRRHLGLRVQRVRAAIPLRGRCAGKQSRRHGN